MTESYLTTHKYVRYLIFAVVGTFLALIALYALGRMFGYDDIFELAKALLGKQDLLDSIPVITNGG